MLILNIFIFFEDLQWIHGFGFYSGPVFIFLHFSFETFKLGSIPFRNTNDIRGSGDVTARPDYVCFDEDIELFLYIAVAGVPEKPTNVCFWGEENNKLFITARTSNYSMQMRVKGL